MTKTNSENKRIEKIVELGEKNKSLLPKVKNWCKNLKIEDRSGGLINEMYNVPTNLSISCLHANGGFTAANFEWIARDFILNYCLQCSFHKEIFSKNFGREVIEIKEDWDRKTAQKLVEINETKLGFKKYVEELKLKERHRTKITELSITKILDELDGNKVEKAEEILEASKLSPQFFSNISIDYLCLYLDNEEINELILKSIYSVSKTRVNFTNFATARLIESIKNKFNDITSGVLYNILTEKYLLSNMNILESLIDNLQYKHQIGDYHEKKYIYANSVKFFLKIYNLNEEYIINFLKKRLLESSVTKRININGFLQEVIDNDYELVKLLIDEIVNSLELDDDDHYDSADRMVCKTLFKLYEKESVFTINKIIERHNQLSVGAIVELLVLFKNIIIEGEEDHAQKLISIVLEFITRKNEDKTIIEKSVEIIKRVTKERFGLVEKYFENFVGILIHFHEEIKTFNHYKNELKEKRISTFNPLQNLNVWEIESLELELNKILNSFKSLIIKHLIKDVSKKNHTFFLTIINNLCSKKDGELKSIFISV